MRIETIINALLGLPLLVYGLLLGHYELTLLSGEKMETCWLI
jgi:hypothetical protein